MKWTGRLSSAGAEDLREFQIRLIFVGERWEVVDFDGVGVDDSEAEAVGR